nr:hypothetical protein [Tanacetum cinerariifolium]
MNYADIDYGEESKTEEESSESEEESSNEDKGIEDNSEDKMYINEKKIRTRNPPKSLANIMSFVCSKCMPMVLKRSSTAVITKWTARKLIMLQKEIIDSNKNIFAPDTDIKTHETNAAKTTPKKERMTKSKIIAAKNAVSQSTIKVVNLGHISGKSSNRISNTPKDAQTKKMFQIKKNAKEQGSTITTNPVDALALVTPTIERKRKDLPMLEYEHVKKNAKDPGPTNTITTFDAMPLSFAMPNEILVTPAVERKRKDFDKENISKGANDKESKKMKRTLKLSNNVKSPFIERLRSPDSMRSLFCHSSMIDNVKALTYFIDDMEFVMKSAKVDNISNVNMVHFHVRLEKSHYYLLVFNLKTPMIEILDNKKLFIQYLSYSEHRSWNLMKKAVCERTGNVDLRMRGGNSKPRFMT